MSARRAIDLASPRAVGRDPLPGATGDGLIAIAATFVSYGLTEMVHCYGFLAVFVTALTLRHSHREHDFQRDMHDITEQVERLAMMVVLLLFGGALVSGLFTNVGVTDVVIAGIVLLVVRPVAGLIGLAGLDATGGEEAADAEQAIGMLEAGHADLLFTDLNMTGMNGLDLSVIVHARWPDVGLLMTSGRQDIPVEMIPDHGLFLDKPYEPKDLVRMVRRCLELRNL